MKRRYNRKDHLYQKAKSEGYRSRAAYKLEELDKKFSLFRSGQRVIDLGCFPGGWLQVAASRVGTGGMVVGIDLKEVEPTLLPNVTTVVGDFTEPSVQEAVLSEGRFDLVISDMSPQLTGVRFADVARAALLVEMAAAFCTLGLAEGGAFVAKIFPGQECEEVIRGIRPQFASLNRVNLDSSRRSSTELYIVCRQKRPSV